MTTRAMGQRLGGTFAAITLSTFLPVLGIVPLTGDAAAFIAKAPDAQQSPHLIPTKERK